MRTLHGTLSENDSKHLSRYTFRVAKEGSCYDGNLIIEKMQEAGSNNWSSLWKLLYIKII